MKEIKQIDKNTLFTNIWKMQNDLRGSLDGWNFKEFWFAFLFYRFLSEKIEKVFADGGLTDQIYRYYMENEPEEFDSIIKEVVNKIGFFIKPEDLFHNVVKNDLDNEDLNVRINNIFDSIIQSTIKYNGAEKQFKDLFKGVDLNRLGKDVNSINIEVRKIMNGIDSLDVGNFEDGSIDLFGDAYEFLMQNYASEAGKQGGEFFTPQEVSELLAKLTMIDFTKHDKPNRTDIVKVYDPTCGSGSLLLKYAKLFPKNKEIHYYGQDYKETMYNLARMNMLLHNIEWNRINIHQGDTLKNPMSFDGRPYDAIVANPPYSIKWDGKDHPSYESDPRFSDVGVLAPKSKADWAFALHMLHELSEQGVIATVMFPGILYRSGAEARIREYLVENNYIEAIIKLPPNLFYGTSIATNILILRKNKTIDDINFVDATELFTKVGKKNVLEPNHAAEILEMIKSDIDTEKSKRVSKQDIKNKLYDLSVETYIKDEEVIEIIDIVALNEEISQTTNNVNELRRKADKLIEKIESGEFYD